MIIKKFQGKTSEEALEYAKKELGAGVVIMNVKKSKAKGWKGFFGASVMEVTVAKEDDQERMPHFSSLSSKMQHADSVDLSKRTNITSQNELPQESSFREEPVMSGIERARKMASEDNTDKASDKAIEEKLDHLQNYLMQQLGREKVSQDQGEHKDSKAEEDSNVRVFRLLYNTMVDNEVDQKYANQIIDEVAKTLKPNMPMEAILSNLYQRMILKFGKQAVISPAAKGPKVLFFVGPTGVGKTTTIAKIASYFCVQEKRKVAMLTADTYRIAAAEQLRTYAGILDAPFRIIYTVEELEYAIRDFATMDYILVDTAGHSHRNEEQKETMIQFIRSLGDYTEKEVFLVLSATTKYKDLLNIADTYAGMTEFSLIFTKLDETSCLGNLLNLRLYTQAPMAYTTCGQNVPDDIAPFDSQGTVKQLLSTQAARVKK